MKRGDIVLNLNSDKSVVFKSEIIDINEELMDITLLDYENYVFKKKELGRNKLNGVDDKITNTNSFTYNSKFISSIHIVDVVDNEYNLKKFLEDYPETLI